MAQKTREELDSDVGKGFGCLALGVVLGVGAYLAETYLNSDANFITWTLGLVGTSLYVASILFLFKVLFAKGETGNDRTPLRIFGLYMAAHYSIVVLCALLAVGLSEHAFDMGGLAFFGLIFALVNVVGGVAGGILFGLFLVFPEAQDRGFNTVAAFMTAVVLGLVEAALCYLLQWMALSFVFG